MPTIIIPTFGGEVPRTTPRLLDNNQASVAVNCQLQRGALEALKGPAHVHRLDKAAKTIFKHDVDGWLSWDKAVNVVKSAIPDIVGDKPLGHLFITGDRDYPTQYFAGGKVYRLGVPRPTKAPTVRVETGAALGNVRAYAFGANEPSEFPARYGYEHILNEVESTETATVSTIAGIQMGSESVDSGSMSAVRQFNVAAVLKAKAKQCNAIAENGRTDWTDTEVAIAIGENYMSIREWWETYGQSESVCPWASASACREDGYTYYVDEEVDVFERELSRSSSYVYTIVQYLADGTFQQESAPSPASEIVDVLEGDGVIVSGFEIPQMDGLSIAYIRIYRTIAGNTSSEFHFVAEIPATQTSYHDTASDLDLASSEVLATTTWDAIPDDAQGLIHADNGLYVCFRGNELLISEPFVAYAFPTDYRLSTVDPIVALAHVDGTIIVLTTGRPYLVAGAEPAQMQITYLPIEQSCVSARSVASLPGGVVYASPDGLMLFSSSEQQLLTAQTWTREQWQALEPEKLLGTVHEGRYVGFFDGSNKGFLFSLGGKDVVWMELPEDWQVLDVYHHSNDDCVYVSVSTPQGHGVWQLEAGEILTYRWRSKPFFLSALTGMSSVRVEGEQSPRNMATVKIYGPDGERVRATGRIGDSKTRRLPTTRAEKVWSVELTGTVTIFEVRIGGSVEGLEYGQ